MVQRIRQRFSYTDEFGVLNYHSGALTGAAFVVLYAIIGLLAWPLLWFEAGVNDSTNIQTYADAFWTLQMSASTIGFGDFYPVSLGGRMIVAAVFYLGVGLVGFIGTLLASKVFGFAETGIKNRELRKQNDDIIAHNRVLEAKLDHLLARLEPSSEVNKP